MFTSLSVVWLKCYFVKKLLSGHTARRVPVRLIALPERLNRSVNINDFTKCNTATEIFDRKCYCNVVKRFRIT